MLFLENMLTGHIFLTFRLDFHTCPQSIKPLTTSSERFYDVHAGSINCFKINDLDFLYLVILKNS